MPPEELLARIRERPFRPFRLHLSDGRAFEVHHPELCMPGKRTAIIGLTGPGQSEALYEGHVTVSLIRVTTLESVNSSVPGNGHQTN